MILWLLGVVVIGGAAVGAGLYYYRQQSGDDVEAEGEADGDGDDTTAAPAVTADDLVELVSSTKAKIAYVVAGAAVFGVLLVAVAFALYGAWSAIAVAVGGLLGLSAPWVYVRVLFTPLGKGAFGTAFAILGQLTFGEGALCRRQDGGYEWGMLREDAHGLYLRLASGRRVPINADRADLPKVAWAPLAVVEEKTDANMRQFTVDETFQTTRPDPTGGDGDVVRTPLALADGGSGWHLDSAKLERWARDSAGAELARNGRRKAFDESGGEQQISQLVTMIGAAVLAVLGFGMTAGVLML
jgi:hypothetical protein